MIIFKTLYTIFSEGCTFSLYSQSTKWPSIKQGGRKALQIKNGVALGYVITAQSVSMFEVSISCLRLQLIDLRV